MYYDKQDIKYLTKLNQRVLARKTNFFRRNLHINKKETNIRIQIYQSMEDFRLAFEGFKDFPELISYLLIGQTKKNLISIKSDVEVIITDWKTNKVIYLIKDNLNNFKLDGSISSYNLWVVKKGTINFYDIKLNDIVFTR